MAGDALKAALLERAKREQADRAQASEKGWGQTIKENILGDDDPTTQNFGERVATLLNMGGEALTLGLVGDEAAARFDSLIGRGSYDDRLNFYRQQEEIAREEAPVASLTAEIAPALLTPGLALASKGPLALRALKSGATAAATGGVYGFMEGEGVNDRLDNARDVAALSGALGAAAPVAVRGLSKAISPNAVVDGKSAAKMAASRGLAEEGVRTTAGQATGNRALQFTEEQMARTAGIMEDQVEDFTKAAMRRIGVEGLATPENLTKATDEIGSVFEDIARGRGIEFTPAQLSQASAVVEAYRESVGTVAALPKNIVSKIRKGTITGAEYNDFASRLGKAKTSNDSALRDAANALRSILDDALEASVPASEAKRLAKARTQYRDLLAIERAASGAGEETARGVISPARLRSAVAAQGRRQYVQGGRDLGELARNGVIGMPRLPSSGTAERMGAMLTRSLGPMASSGSIGGLIGSSIAGPPGAVMGAGLGVLMPGLSRALTASKPGQAYLANQAAKGLSTALTPGLTAIAPRASEAYMAR